MRFDVFLDALNLTNSAPYESVGSVLGTATTDSARDDCRSAPSSVGKEERRWPA